MPSKVELSIITLKKAGEQSGKNVFVLRCKVTPLAPDGSLFFRQKSLIIIHGIKKYAKPRTITIITTTVIALFSAYCTKTLQNGSFDPKNT